MHHQPSVYDHKAFYNTRTGRVVRRILQQRIREFWPEVHGLRVMGIGYATPYLRLFMEQAERVFAVMPGSRGAHHWPAAQPDEKNLVCMAHGSELPFETASIDRVLMVHSMEFSDHIETRLAEVWRVLKSTGRVLVVVPNRSGFWAHADWSPFGQGQPYSAGQIAGLMRDALFVHERTEEGLFMLPLRWAWFLKSAGLFERVGRNTLPFGAGVHMIEASKQLYARPEPPKGLKAPVRVMPGLVKPAV